MYSGGWDTNGVSVVNVSNDTVTCTSLHLTSFAVLVDVAGTQQVCCTLCKVICGIIQCIT